MKVSYFRVTNFRSLRKIEIKECESTTLFYGENNTGKSNILSAFEAIFKTKVPKPAVTPPSDASPPSPMAQNFWSGLLEPFGDNFYHNSKGDIEFDIHLAVENRELESVRDGLVLLNKDIFSKTLDLGLKGRFIYIDRNSAEMKLDAVGVNEYSAFAIDAKGAHQYFQPLAEALDQAKRVQLFERLLEPFNDCFKVVSCSRVIVDEEFKVAPTKELLPTTLKSWLHTQSLDRDSYEEFSSIKRILESEPFAFGEIGFSTNGNKIEIMVEKDGLRIPISRLGSGWQQIVFIIASIVHSKGKMVGIEELEQNLSPTAQLTILEKLKHFVEKEENQQSRAAPRAD